MSTIATIKRLKEERGKLVADLRALGDKLAKENRSFNTEERAAFDKMKTDLTGLDQRLKDLHDVQKAGKDERTKPGRHDRDGRKDTKPKSSKPTAEDHRTAFSAWARAQYGRGLTRTHLDACKRTKVNPRSKYFDIRFRAGLGSVGEVQRRDQGVGTAGAGGYTVPQDFSGQLEIALKVYNPIRQACDSFTTETGADMPWPTVNDTSNSGELIAENTAVAAQDMTFNTVTFKAYKFSSKAILVANELMNDSFFDIGTLIASMAGERIGRVQNTFFTTGTGTAQPHGAVTAAPLGHTAALANALSVDDIVKFYFKIEQAYRNDPKFAFMLHGDLLATLALLKDGQGRPLLMDSYRDSGDTFMMLGKPVVSNNAMTSTIATGNKVLLGGAWSKFKIRDIGMVRFRRLEERYAEKDQVGFIAFMRSDSRLLDAGTNPIEHLAMA